MSRRRRCSLTEQRSSAVRREKYAGTETRTRRLCKKVAVVRKEHTALLDTVMLSLSSSSSSTAARGSGSERARSERHAHTRLLLLLLLLHLLLLLLMLLL